MKRFLCLYLPRWPLQRLCAVKPELRGKAAALFERSAHGLRLAVCSVEANTLGVKRGMLLADATALAPDLALHELDRQADREALEKLALWAGRFTPLVGLESADPSPYPLPQGERGTAEPQALLLDITGCEQVFHGEQQILRQAVQGLARKGFKARAAIAPTIGAAWALAHYGANGGILTAETQRHREQTGIGSRGSGVEAENPKLEIRNPKETENGEKESPGNGYRDSRIGNADPKPDTPYPIPETRCPREIASATTVFALGVLPLSALRLDAEAMAWLNKLGLHRIGDVLNQPRSALPSRFGPQLLARVDQALGAAPEIMPLVRPAPEFHATKAFEYRITNLEWLYPVIEGLAAKLAADMQQRCRGAREIECWLYQEMGEPLCAAVTLHKASASAKHLLQLLRTKLEDVRNRIQNSEFKIHNDGGVAAGQGGGEKARPLQIENQKSKIKNVEPEDGIRAVSLRVMASEPLDAEQLALFHQAVRTPEGLALTLDRLSTRLGRDAVLRPTLVDDAQPEDAVEWRMLDEPRATAGLSRGASLASQEPEGERPLQLLPAPEPINVFWPRHSLKPLRFEWRGKLHIVKEASGPERIETGWWKERYVRRDYYVVETAAGGRYWIFQRRDDEQWFVHGVFG